jgi:P27 family predicted phage terminase small subunit
MNAPSHLDKPAKKKWREVLPILLERGDLDQATLDGLAIYCSAWSRWITAEAKVCELGAVVRSPAGFAIANPYLAVAAAAQRHLRQWGRELGLTPASRRKAKKTTAKTTKNPLTRLKVRA